MSIKNSTGHARRWNFSWRPAGIEAVLLRERRVLERVRAPSENNRALEGA